MSRPPTPRGTPIAERLRMLSEVDPDGCWIWRAGLDRHGYARIGMSHQVNKFAHRVSYETFVAPIPDGMTVDHLCFKPACINPHHLRLLTNLDNARNQRKAFKTQCVHGHDLTPENTKYQLNQRNPAGPRHRLCAQCRRESDRRRRAS